MLYQAIYKCRMCGDTYIRASVPNTEEVVRAFFGLNGIAGGGYQPIDYTDMHSCEDGSFGLADFQGFKKADS